MLLAKLLGGIRLELQAVELTLGDVDQVLEVEVLLVGLVLQRAILLLLLVEIILVRKPVKKMHGEGGQHHQYQQNGQ